MSKRPLANLFADAPCSLLDEEVIELLSAENVRIKRVVSTGQVSPPGRWYDQDWAEWVVVLTGSARLLFEGEGIETAADCPAANTVSNRSTAAFCLTPWCVVTTPWRPSGSSR